MTRSNRTHLIAEQAFLRAQLASLPANATFTRNSTESRLGAVAEALAREPEREPARAKLTFNGRPVVRSHGLYAEFGMKAINSFADAIATVAASLNAPLHQMGPIPNRDQYQLLITGTAVGSFGFELEELSSNQMSLGGETSVQQALTLTSNILSGSIAQDDELLADAASNVDRRALDKVRTFVGTLADNEAICTLQFENHEVKFTSVGQVNEAFARLSTDNLIEVQTTLVGSFQGVIASRRTFEFNIQGGDVIVGKIAPTIDDPYDINHHLEELVTVQVLETRVGAGRPRYLLLNLPWTPVQLR